MVTPIATTWTPWTSTSAKQRTAYIRQATTELGSKEDVIKKDLGSVLLKLEELQERAIRQALEAKPKAPHVGETEATPAALELLRDPHLVSRILEDFDRCGVVGEEPTSWLPGRGVAQAGRAAGHPHPEHSAAGKSSLMEACSPSCPRRRSRILGDDGAVLFYMGDADLRHKVLAVVEEEGAARASYALKLLQRRRADHRLDRQGPHDRPPRHPRVPRRGAPQSS